MAAAAPIALAMQVAGGIMGGIESNRAARAGARVDTENSRLTLLEGEQQAMQTRRDERGIAGDMIAAMGGAGITLGSGSAADVLAQSAYQRELEVFNIRTRATGEANNLLQSAEEKRKAGRAALIGSVFGAGAAALKGVSDMRARRAPKSSSGGPAPSLPSGPVPRMSVGGSYGG